MNGTWKINVLTVIVFALARRAQITSETPIFVPVPFVTRNCTRWTSKTQFVPPWKALAYGPNNAKRYMIDFVRALGQAVNLDLSNLCIPHMYPGYSLDSYLCYSERQPHTAECHLDTET